MQYGIPEELKNKTPRNVRKKRTAKLQVRNAQGSEPDGIPETERQAGAGLWPPGMGWEVGGGVHSTYQLRGCGSRARAEPEDKASGPP